MVAGSSLFLARPADAGRNCLSTLTGPGAGGSCIAQCLANLQQVCADTADPSLCAQQISTQVLILANLRPGMACNEAKAFINDAVCGCP